MAYTVGLETSVWAKELMQDNRPAVYLEGDCVIYRASGFGCLRAQWAARNDMGRKPIPLTIRRGMDEGTNLEPIILELLEVDHHFIFNDGRQRVVELNLGAWNGKTLIVRGKVDEVGHPKFVVGDLPIDVKAFTEDDVEKYRAGHIMAFPRYAWQQSVYAHGFDRDQVYMPIFHKGKWQIEPWTLTPVPIPYTIDQIRDRVLSVEEAYYNNAMPEECPADYACPYPYLHDVKPTLDVPEESVLLVKARIKLGKRETIYKNAKSEIDKKLRTIFDQEVTYRLDGYTISVYANPKRFNTDVVKQLLTEAEIDWEHEDKWWIAGKGTQVRFTPPKEGEK